jgi:L-threonylcarbamoyladenylate synthase
VKIIKMDDVGESIVEKIRSGTIFVYPTDTIYGIGCNALDEVAVKKIFRIKKRDDKMALSVIAPSFEWIAENCDADMGAVKKYLPGHYTLILRKKKKGFLLSASAGKETIGVRIIKHKIMRFFEMAGVPFVTTSVNVSGEEPIKDVMEIPEEIKKHVDIAIDGGRISGRPSKIVDLSRGEEKIIER